MGLGVLCLAISVILFAAVRLGVLGNTVWATSLGILLAITLLSALPFVPLFYRCLCASWARGGRG
ncbi:hypothetical protein BKA70DRAFT_1326009 [Coprinopsis sp. MPI-PUGE-AT-0042]|nr:hypothetical protein BKA70DRAFT_1326009 [Coprinopsis sp. MPI-PUGE-AT-0042]